MTFVLKACDPVTGTPNAFIMQYQGCQISTEMSDVGSISFEYLRTGVNADSLDQNVVEIATFLDGIEIDDGRFIVTSDSDDEIKTDETRKFTGTSLLNWFKKAIVYSADGSVTQGVDQVFENATPGGIIKALFDQNQARGTNRVCDRITYASFSNTTDSNGDPWTFELGSITYTVGVSYLDVLRNLFDNGMVEFKFVGRDFRLYNAGSMGTDRTAVSEPVVLRKGRDLEEAPRTRTKEAIAAVALVAGNEGVLSQFIDPSVAAAWGEDEVFISQGGISDPTTLAVLSQKAVENVSQIRIENTHKVALSSSPYTPYVDYGVSDYIYTDRGNGSERLRIRQIVITVEAGTPEAASLVLNDKFLENEIAISRRVNGILGGATATGSVAIPTEEDPGADTTVPKSPTGVVAVSSAYVDTGGNTVAQASVTWTAVTQNIDGSTISDLDHYETQYKFDTSTAVVEPSALNPGREDETLTRKFDRRGKGFGWLYGQRGYSARTDAAKDWWLYGKSLIGTADGDGHSTGTTTVWNAGIITDPNDDSTFTNVIGYGNKLSANDAFLESGLGLWQADANCTVARDTTASFYGTASLKITSSSAGDATARIAAPATSNYAVDAFSVFTASCKAKTLSGTARNVQMLIRWYDSSNALLSTTTGASVAGSTTEWLRYNVKGTAPINAVRATVCVVFKGTASGQILNVDQISLAKGDQTMAGWNDPNRGAAGGPVALLCPEELGGSQIASSSLAANNYDCAEVFARSGNMFGILHKVDASGAFLSITALATWDATTLALKNIINLRTADVVRWGTAQIYPGDGYLYLFGSSGNDDLLMRYATPAFPNTTPEWSTGGSTFTTTRASAAAVRTSTANHITSQNQIGTDYEALALTTSDGTIHRLSSANVWGPYTDEGVAFICPDAGGSLQASEAKIHYQLKDSSGYSYSYTLWDTSGLSTDSRDYGPKFVRGPKSIQGPTEPIANWSDVRIIDTGSLVDYIGGLPASGNFQARVRAADSNGHKSLWALGDAIRLASDTTPPNKPSTPIVASQFQGIRIEWDGRDYLNGPPPADWAELAVHVSDVANFTPSTLTLVDTYYTRLGGVTPLQGLDYGKTYYVRFVATDRLGNKSDPSDVASSAPEQLVNTAEIAAKLIQGAQIADGTINTRALTVASFEPSAVPNGGFEDQSLNADGTPTGNAVYWGSSGFAIGGGATVTRDTASPISGAASLKMVMATASDGMRWASAKFPVTEGKVLAASVKVRASRAIANPAFEIHIVCGNTEANTGTSPSAGVSVWGTSATITGTTSVQTLELQRVVDTNMKYAQVFITALAASDGGGGWTAYFDDVNVLPVGGSAFIADASIINAKIANLAVDNAKIANLSIGKLTAGILSADATVSARIKTADTGARVELNSSGLQAYDGSGNNTINFSSADGSALITGRFRTGLTGARLEMIDTTDRTTIDFFGTAAVDPAFMNSPVDGSGSPRIGINTGPFTMLGVSSKHRLFLNNGSIQLETYQVSGGATLGYRLFMDSGTAFIGRTTAAGDNTGGEINATSSGLLLEGKSSGTANARINLNTNGIIQTRGRLYNNRVYSYGDADEFLIAGWSNGGLTPSNDGSTITLSHTYGTTFSTIPALAYSTIRPSAVTGTNRPSSSLVGQSATGFTVAFAASFSIDLTFIAIRTQNT